MVQFRDELEEFIYNMMNLKRSVLKKVGLYVGQPLILKIMQDHPGMTQIQLAKAAGIKPPTLNVMLTRMAKNELVEIKNDENNSKIRKVYLTTKRKKN